MTTHHQKDMSKPHTAATSTKSSSIPIGYMVDAVDMPSDSSDISVPTAIAEEHAIARIPCTSNGRSKRGGVSRLIQQLGSIGNKNHHQGGNNNNNTKNGKCYLQQEEHCEHNPYSGLVTSPTSVLGLFPPSSPRHDDDDNRSNASEHALQRDTGTSSRNSGAAPPLHNQVVHVDILISPASSTLPIPTWVQLTLSADILQLREEEMKAIAKDAHIPFDRWSCSLLYSMWKKKEPSASSSTHISVETCTEIQSIWSHDFMLTLEKFYQTGILHVTTEISGRPILLFLEYFGIVYSPDKVTYESYDAYLRMKVWTDYLSKKSDLASYLIQQMTNVSTNSDNNVQLFVTTKDPAEGTVGTVHYVQDQPCHVFDYDGFTTTNSTTLEDGKTTPSCALIYNLFNEEPTTEGTINNNACFFKMIREDFSQFMENSTPGAQVTFEVVEVSLKTTILTLSIGPRAVLTLIPAVIEKTQELEEKTNLATDPLEDSPHFIADDSNIPTAPIIAEKPKSSYLQAPSSSNEEHSEQYVDEDFFLFSILQCRL